MEKLPIHHKIQTVKYAMSAIGKCTECIDTRGRACSQNGPHDKMIYDLSVENNEVRYNPHLEVGRIDECIIFKAKK